MTTVRRPWRWRACAVCVILCGAAVPSAPALDVAAPYVHADSLWDRGYIGAGVQIGVIDMYVADGAHPAIAGGFLGYKNFSQPPALVGSHATEVAGAAASRNATYTGPAPGAGLWSAQTANKKGLSSERIQTIAAETFAQGLDVLGGDAVEVITLSIGFDALSTAGTDQWSMALDHVVHTNGQTVTVAAGNSGPGSGTLDGLPTGAYNVITVGATGGSLPEDYSHVAGFSSRGPTSDGRCKPDIVAPGSEIYLPTPGGGWASVSGTSFATPLVAGGAAALIGMGRQLGYDTDPKVVKSVLLNSADKLDGWTHTPDHPLDYTQGAGQMDLRNSYAQYFAGEQGPGAVRGIGWDIAPAAYDAENFYQLDLDVFGGERLVATVVWDRIVVTNGEDIETVNYSVDHLDDLDLYLYLADDLTTPVASSVSRVDNVEHIYYTAGETGRYVIGVEMAGGAVGDMETYCLTWRLERIPGDADFDGVVNDVDLSAMLAHWEQSGRQWSEGEFTGDGVVNDSDLSVVLVNWYRFPGPPAGGVGGPADGAAVPEPAALAVLGLGAIMLLRGKQRRGGRGCPH